jgi:hypothetical protein
VGYVDWEEGMTSPLPIRHVFFCNQCGQRFAVDLAYKSRAITAEEEVAMKLSGIPFSEIVGEECPAGKKDLQHHHPK